MTKFQNTLESPRHRSGKSYAGKFLESYAEKWGDKVAEKRENGIHSTTYEVLGKRWMFCKKY